MDKFVERGVAILTATLNQTTVEAPELSYEPDADFGA